MPEESFNAPPSQQVSFDHHDQYKSSIQEIPNLENEKASTGNDNQNSTTKASTNEESCNSDSSFSSLSQVFRQANAPAIEDAILIDSEPLQEIKPLGKPLRNAQKLKTLVMTPSAPEKISKLSNPS